MTWHATALGPDDNVAIALEPVAAGQDVVVDLGGTTTTVTVREPIALAHKIALVDLRPGDPLVKYGEVIGEAIAPIARGAWVHIHNLRSRRARHDGATPAAFDPHAYMNAAGAAVGLPIPPTNREGVAANLARLEALAQEVLAFEIPARAAFSTDFTSRSSGRADSAAPLDPRTSDSLRTDATLGDVTAAGASVSDVAAAVRAGVASAHAVVEAALARIERCNPAINAFTAIAAERALGRAKRIDAARRAGKPLGALAGVPFGVKAMIDLAGLTTTAGSALYRDAAPADRDADIVQRLEAAGAVCVGALNMDEFGMGGTTENARFGPTRNPHDVTRTPGGSSGGSAAAVAAGMVPIAIGSDGLGSVRLPASLCGVFGLRPTRGVIGDEGVLDSGGTLATLGLFARSSRDIALCHHAVCMQGRAEAHDRRGQPPDTRGAAPVASDTPIRLATAGGYFREGLDDDAAEAVQRVVDALRITREVEYPHAHLARAAAILVNATESASGRLDALRTRLDAFDPSTRERFLAHGLLPAQWYLAAQRLRRWHIGQVVQLFEQVDVLVVPATPCVAPKIGARTLRIGNAELPVGPALGWFTQPIAGTDCPALTVPIARPGRLAIGVQLVARHRREDLLFRVAARLEALGVAAAPVAAQPG